MRKCFVQWTVNEKPCANELICLKIWEKWSLRIIKGKIQILSQDKKIYGGKIFQILNSSCFILYLFVSFPIYVSLQFLTLKFRGKESRSSCSLTLSPQTTNSKYTKTFQLFVSWAVPRESSACPSETLKHFFLLSNLFRPWCWVCGDIIGMGSCGLRRSSYLFQRLMLKKRPFPYNFSHCSWKQHICY